MTIAKARRNTGIGMPLQKLPKGKELSKVLQKVVQKDWPKDLQKVKRKAERKE